MLPKPIYHWNTEHYQESADHGELYIDSDINFQASITLWNTQLYPVSVRNCPRPEYAVFYILIIDIILRSALVLFSLLCEINDHYNKGNIKVEFFKCKTIYSILLCISVQRSIFLRWFINIVIIYIIARYTCGSKFAAIVYWPTKILLFLSCFVLNYHGTFILSQILNLFICGIFKRIFFHKSKKSTFFAFLSTATSAENKFWVTKPIYHWKTEQYQRTVDHGEIYLNSYTNILISGNTLLYPVSVSSCPGPEHGASVF